MTQGGLGRDWDLLSNVDNHKIGTLNSYPWIGELTYCMANSLGKVKYSKMDRYLWDWFTNLDAYGLHGCIWSWLSLSK